MTTTHNNKVYWTSSTDDCVLQYQAAGSDEERNNLFTSQLYTPFSKLAENVSNAFNNTKGYVYQSQEDIESDILTHMVKAIPSFDAKNGKGFSYFTTVGKRYLIWMNKVGYRNTMREPSLDLLHEYSNDDTILTYQPAEIYLSDDPRYQEKLIAHFEKYGSYYFPNPICQNICRYLMDIAKGIQTVPVSNERKRSPVMRERALVKAIRQHCELENNKYNSQIITHCLSLYFLLTQFLLRYYVETNDIPDRHVSITRKGHPFTPTVGGSTHGSFTHLAFSFNKYNKVNC